MREIIFDTETTGLSPLDGHRLVEIGCVEIVHKVETGRTFHAYLNPQRPMPREAEAVHGLSDAFLADKPCFHEIVDDFLSFIGNAPLVAHNAMFDLGFINHELRKAKRPPLFVERMIDTLQIARSKLPGAKHSLDALCQRYNVDLSARGKHGALLDAQLLTCVYVELTGGRQIGMELEIAESAVPEVRAAYERVMHAARLHHASEHELERHRQMVATLKDPVWLME